MSKITYWKCVDCGSMIDDSNMHDRHETQFLTYLSLDSRYAEFCYGCMCYNPEVVIGYA